MFVIKYMCQRKTCQAAFKQKIIITRLHYCWFESAIRTLIFPFSLTLILLEVLHKFALYTTTCNFSANLLLLPINIKSKTE